MFYNISLVKVPVIWVPHGENHDSALQISKVAAPQYKSAVKGPHLSFSCYKMFASQVPPLQYLHYLETGREASQGHVKTPAEEGRMNTSVPSPAALLQLLEGKKKMSPNHTHPQCLNAAGFADALI